MAKVQINSDALADRVSDLIEVKLHQFEQNLMAKFAELLKASTENLHCNCCVNTAGNGERAPSTASVTCKPVALTTQTNSTRQAPTTIIIGDSITKDLAPGGIAKLAGESIRIRSKSGATPATVFDSDIKAAKLVLHAGTNCLTMAPPEDEQKDSIPVNIASQITAKLDQLKDASEDKNIKMYYSSILKRYDIGDINNCTVGLQCNISEINNIVKGHCKDRNYIYIDNDNLTDIDLFDGLHVNADGATKLAKNIGKALRGDRQTDHEQRTDTDTTNGKTHFNKIQAKRYGTRQSAEIRRRPALLGDYWPDVHEAHRPAWRQASRPAANDAPLAAWREAPRPRSAWHQSDNSDWQEARRPAWHGGQRQVRPVDGSNNYNRRW